MFSSHDETSKISFVRLMKGLMPRQSPIHVTLWPNNGTQQRAKHNVNFAHFSAGSTGRQATGVTKFLNKSQYDFVAGC